MPQHTNLIHLWHTRNNTFAGRAKELSFLKNNFSSGAYQTQIVSGKGGYGKTQIIHEFAHQNLNQYEIIWIVDASNLEYEFQRLYAQVSREYAHLYDNCVDPKELLSKISSWLLIIDNVKSPDSLLDYLPNQNGKQHVLIASRCSVGWESTYAHQHLDSFSDEDAVELLKKMFQYRIDINENDMQILANLSYNSPLKLAQSAIFIVQTKITIEEYKKFLTEQRDELWGVEDRPRDYNHTILTVWKDEINELLQERYVRALIFCGAFFLPRVKLSVDTFKFDNVNIQSAIIKLLQSSLVSYETVQTTGNSHAFISFDPLFQLVIRDRMTRQERESSIQLALALGGGLETYDMELIKISYEDVTPYWNNPNLIKEKYLKMAKESGITANTLKFFDKKDTSDAQSPGQQDNVLNKPK